MKLYRSFVTVAGYTIGSRIFGFIRTVLTANYLGTGAETAALTMALKLPSVLRRIFAEGAFNAAFIPMFSGILSKKGSQTAHSFAQDIFNILLWSLIVITILAELIMPHMLSILLPGFQETPSMNLVILYTRITFPFIIFISLCAFYSGILNSHDRFAAVAASPMMGNIGLILIFFILYPILQDGGVSMAIGALGLGVIQAWWVWYPCKSINMQFRLHKPELNANVKQFLKKLGPAIAGGGVVQINTLISAAIASCLHNKAGIGYLEFAERLNQLPLSVIGTAISTVTLPLLAKHFRMNNHKEALHTQTHALEFSLYLTLPAAIGLACLAIPIVTVLFEHGAFTATATQATATTLQIMSLGLPAYVLVKVFTTTFFAKQDTTLPLYTACGSMIIDVVLSITLIGPLQHVGIALAAVLASWANVVALCFVLYKRKLFVIHKELQRFLIRIFVICILTGACLIALSALIVSWKHAWLPLQIITLSFFVIMGLGIYFCLCHYTNTYNLGTLRQNFKKIKGSSNNVSSTE